MSKLFVSFEGIEGCGKSTQLDRLLGEFVARRTPAVALREPGSTPIGQQIRSLLLDPAFSDMSVETELLLYEASRAQLVRTVIVPNLARGHNVLCDRFTDSTVAYQCYGRGLDRVVVDRLNEVATGGLAVDLTVLLDVPAEVGLGRVRGTKDRIEREPLEFHERVRSGFLALAAEEPERFLVLDGAESVSEIAERVALKVFGTADGVADGAADRAADR